jgi:branched-chain amino acid transport system permease protein
VNISKLYTLLFGIGAALAGLAGALIGTIQSVEVGMGEPILILAFVIIVIGGIGSIKGALIASLLVGLVDTLGRFLIPWVLQTITNPSDAMSIGSAIGSMLIYILMAIILILRPTGLYGKKLS